jgi:hypothetical protein
MIISSKNLDCSRFGTSGRPGFRTCEKADENETHPLHRVGWEESRWSLPTRRRSSTTTHGTGGGKKKHMIRIEATAATVKRLGSLSVGFCMIFCIA